MDDLFACEPMASEQELGGGQAQVQSEVHQVHQQKYIIPAESRSYEDPALLNDSRVLDNIIERQSNDGNNLEGVDYFATVQTEIKPHMRKIVSDWMLEVSEEQQCQPDVFHLAVNYMDRFLSKVHIKKSQFQLLGAVCLFLASKFKEVTPLPAENLVIYTDNSITAFEITQWELVVLDVIGWELSAVTPYYILDHLLRSIDFKDSNVDMVKVRMHAETFQALAATEHAFMGQSPAVVALACLADALRGLRCEGLEELFDYLEKSTGVKKELVFACMDQIEVSIKLSMSGATFQPQEQQQKSVPVPPTPSQKVIPQQQQPFFSQSTTPNDLMEVSNTSTCVY